MHEISQSFSLAPSQAMQVAAAKLNATNNNDEKRVNGPITNKNDDGSGTHHKFNNNTPFNKKIYISFFKDSNTFKFYQPYTKILILLQSKKSNYHFSRSQANLSLTKSS
jgi:hypothetical protein